jgi:5'-AMP-activated protein kinase catalytic alpha subunit/calcium-dependent protein kinase
MVGVPRRRPIALMLAAIATVFAACGFYWRRVLLLWWRSRFTKLLASQLQAADSHPATIGPYPVVRALSSGLYGNIYLVKDKASDSPLTEEERRRKFFLQMRQGKMVIKQLKIQPNSSDKVAGCVSKEDALVEVQLMRALAARGGHVNVLPLIDDFYTKDYLNMVLEHGPGGDLLCAMEAQPEEKFTEYQACMYFRQLVDGLTFIHAQGIVHRDVSLENLLLCGNNVKLCDFGLAAYHTPLPKGLSELVGKIIYMAPEVR